MNDKVGVKYKQEIVPEISIVTRKNLVAYVKKEYTESVQGTTIRNLSTGLRIYFGSDGKAELSSGRAMYAKKAALVQCLPELLTVAEYTSFGQRKEKDEKSVLGYAKFKAKVIIDGQLEHAHIVVQVRSTGKGYYCHEINIKKKESHVAGLDKIASNAQA